MQTGGASYYYTTDALGSVIALTNPADTAAATYTYDHWGNTTSNGTTPATNPWRYTGGYQDPSGYLKLGARYYNPITSRFTQTDPAGQGPNPYTYAADNPTNNTDPTGRSELGDFFAGLGADSAVIVGAATLPVTAPIVVGLVIGAVGAPSVSTWVEAPAP